MDAINIESQRCCVFYENNMVPFSVGKRIGLRDEVPTSSKFIKKIYFDLVIHNLEAIGEVFYQQVSSRIGGALSDPQAKAEIIHPIKSVGVRNQHKTSIGRAIQRNRII